MVTTRRNTPMSFFFDDHHEEETCLRERFSSTPLETICNNGYIPIVVFVDNQVTVQRVS